MNGFRFGTVGTPISTPKKPGGAVGGIQRLHELSLDAFEIGWVRSVRVKEETCLLIKETALETEVAVSVHAPYYINLNADKDEWPKSRKRLMDAAHYGFLAGATDIIFHPGSYFGKDPEDVLKVAIPRLKEIVRELRRGDNTVTLRPETMGKGAMLGSFEDTLQMSQQIDGVLPCLDFAHLHARTGDGSMNSQAEWKALLVQYRDALGDDSLQDLHCHLSGIEYSDKGEKKHLMLEDSDFNLEDLMRALSEQQCGGRILCESPTLEDDALLIREAWSRIGT
jgi:deoxyribonuclease-4